MRKFFILIFTGIIFSFSSFLFSENSTEYKRGKLLLSYLMGITTIPQMGSESDYSQGINSFPIIPSHSVKTVSGELSINLIKNFYATFTLDYSMNTKLRVYDPSDNDSFVFDTLSFYNYYLGIRYKTKLLGINSFISLGSGKTYTNGAEQENVITEKGYTVLIEEAKAYSQWLFIGNFGFDIKISEGVCLSGKISYLKLTEDKTNYLQFLAGLKFIILHKRRK